jgi:hypothetical protein
MRPLIKTAVQMGNANTREAKKQTNKPKQSGKPSKGEVTDGDETAPHASSSTPPGPTLQKEKEIKDFVKHSSSAPRRLNDIVQAPPELKKLPRGAAKSTTSKSTKSDGVVSMVQKQMMEVERERAVARYRELKVSRRKEIPEQPVLAE